MKHIRSVPCRWGLLRSCIQVVMLLLAAASRRFVAAEEEYFDGLSAGPGTGG